MLCTNLGVFCLSYDEQWAEIIRWLQKRNLLLHVPRRGQIWFEDKATGQRAPGF